VKRGAGFLGGYPGIVVSGWRIKKDNFFGCPFNIVSDVIYL